MNKAFTREADAPAPTCPAPEGCGWGGTLVPDETVRSLVGPEEAAAFTSEVYWCANPACPVAWFDAWGRTALISRLAVVPWPKNPHGPVCSCLGVPAETIVEEAARGEKTAVLRVLEHLRSGAATCVTSSPDGRPCEQAVRRLFLQHRRP